MITLRQLIEQLVDRALEEGIITTDEVTELDTIEIDENKIGGIMMSNFADDVYEIVQKIFSNLSEVIIRKNKALILKNLNNGKIIWDLLFSSFLPNISKNKFVFKINVLIDDNTIIGDMLSAFDNVYCVRTNVNEVATGLCLGTKHFLIDGDEVSLLSFAKKDTNTSAWVEKGSYIDIPYNDVVSFNNHLKRTAQNLLANYYATH